MYEMFQSRPHALKYINKNIVIVDKINKQNKRLCELLKTYTELSRNTQNIIYYETNKLIAKRQ